MGQLKQAILAVSLRCRKATGFPCLCSCCQDALPGWTCSCSCTRLTHKPRPSHNQPWRPPARFYTHLYRVLLPSAPQVLQACPWLTHAHAWRSWTQSSGVCCWGKQQQQLLQQQLQRPAARARVTAEAGEQQPRVAVVEAAAALAMPRAAAAAAAAAYRCTAVWCTRSCQDWRSWGGR